MKATSSDDSPPPATPSTTPSSPESTPATASPTTPTAATWPEWFFPVDLALVIAALIAAFCITAFPARNSDLWVHLASGRAIASGELPLGQDLWSQVGTARHWLQSSWLFDTVAYLSYSLRPEGEVLISLKAALFFAAMLLTLRLRKPGTALWPWAVLILAGSVAVGPFVTLRSLAVSPFMLALVLTLLYRGKWDARSWKQPLLVAAVVAFWANLDAWALLGPLTVLLVLLGQWIDRLLNFNSDNDPLPPEPPTAALLRTLSLCLVAMLLNPSLLSGLVQQPVETLGQMIPLETKIGLPEEMANDPEYDFLLRSPFTLEHFQSRQRGQNWNGLAFIVMVLVGIAVLACSYKRLRGGAILLFVVFAALAFHHTRLMIFLPVVLVPIVASYWNAFSNNIALVTWSDPNTRIILTLSILKRVLAVILSALVVLAIYPGWVQPELRDPALQQRLEFSIIADPGLVRAAQRLEAIRQENSMPPDLRGLNTSAQLGDYLAWFAPTEKAFINSRIRYHLPELQQVLSARREVVSSARSQLVPPDLDKLTKVMDETKTHYLVQSSYYLPLPIDDSTQQMLNTPEQWQLWHLDGRLLVMARLTDDVKRIPSQETIFTRYVVRQAFRTSEQRLPKASLDFPLPPERPFWETYFDRPAPVPLSVDDFSNWEIYLQILRRSIAIKAENDAAFRTNLAMSVAGVTLPMAAFFIPPTPREDVEFALGVLMMRSARRACAEAPDRPNGFLALSRVLREQVIPIANVNLPGLNLDERAFLQIAARQRLLDRILPAGQGADLFASMQAFQQGLLHADALQQTGQLDYAEFALRRALTYAEILPAPQLLFAVQSINSTQLQIPQDPKKLDEEATRIRKSLEQQVGNLSREIQQRSDQLKRAPTKVEKFFALAQFGLAKEALELHEQLTSEDFREREIPAMIARQTILLRAGLHERAAFEMDKIESDLEKRKQLSAEKQNQADVQLCEAAQRQLKEYRSLLARAAGNLSEVLDLEGQVPLPVIPADLAKAAVELPRFLEGFRAIAGPLAGNELFNVRQLLLLESQFQYDRAMLNLIHGDIPAAEQRLQMALKPQGYELTRLGEANRAALIQKYLDLMVQAR